MTFRATIAAGLRWSIGGKLIAQAVSWLVTLFVIRLLHPDDYGLMAMAMSVAALAMLLNDLGVTSAVVQRRDLTDDEIRAWLGLLLISNSVLLLMIFMTIPLIANYYQDNRVGNILLVLALHLPIQGFGLIYAALLIRQLDFKTKTLIDMGSLLTGSVATLAMAVANLGVWALVLGYVVAATARSLGFSLMASKRYRPSWRIDQVIPMVKFGGIIVAQRLVWWCYTQADVLILGRLYQAEAVGVYAVARHLATLPHQQIGAVLNQVTLASFARIQQDSARARDHLVQAIRMLAFVTVPVFAAISALAPEAVHVLLGEEWLRAVDPIRILALIMPLRMISGAISEVLNARGHALFMLGNTLVLLVVVVPAIVIGGFCGGVLGVCVAWAVGFSLAFAVTTTRARSYTLLGVSDIMKSLVRPLLGATVMYLVVELLRASLRGSVEPVAMLVILATAAFVSCAVTAFLLDRSLFRDVLSFVRT